MTCRKRPDVYVDYLVVASALLVLAIVLIAFAIKIPRYAGLPLFIASGAFIVAFILAFAAVDRSSDCMGYT